jgi:hypothetical protein
MKNLRTILFGFSLGAAGLILTAVLWINDDYYTTLLASHPGYHSILPHSLAWSLPYIFVLFTLISSFCVTTGTGRPAALLRGI